MKTRVEAYAYDKRGKLLSIGHNSYKRTHPVQARFAKLAGYPQKQYLHAEIDALVRARGRQVHKLFVCRYGRAGETRLAKPCPVCELAINNFRVRLVEYTA